jgi:hypothetical protein
MFENLYMLYLYIFIPITVSCHPDREYLIFKTMKKETRYRTLSCLELFTQEILPNLMCIFITINVPVVYKPLLLPHINNRYIGCFMYQPWTYNMRICMAMYVLCDMPF